MRNMRHCLKIVVTVGIALVLGACGSSRKVANEYSRETELNEKLQEITQGNWQLHGSTRTLRGKLTEHYAKMETNPDFYEVIGTSSGCRSVTVCRASAFNGASMDLATKMGQELRGKTMRDLGIDEGAELPAEFNRFQQACIGKFQATISGDLMESFALIRRGADGLNQYEIYYIVDKQSERKRRMQAVRDALDESKLQKEYARSIEKYVENETE